MNGIDGVLNENEDYAVARPADPREFGIYDALLLGKLRRSVGTIGRSVGGDSTSRSSSPRPLQGLFSSLLLKAKFLHTIMMNLSSFLKPPAICVCVSPRSLSGEST
jgi:hypothetical protein